MNTQEIRTIGVVYRKLLEREVEAWNGLDDYLEMLDYMTDDEIYRESELLRYGHKDKQLGCDRDHPKEKCFIPVFFDACSSILELYEETNSLHPKNRYILEYYLALTQAGYIQIKN